MVMDNDELLESILKSLDRIIYIKPGDIPNIGFYMDQVTGYMEKALNHTVRYPDTKVLTKTMINNYTKNKLLPPPDKKKYSKEHMLMLIFIYYFKGVMSMNDIQTLLKPITEKYFQNESGFKVEDIYKELVDMGKDEILKIKEDVKVMYKKTSTSFEETATDDQDFLKKFAFICMLSVDVYVKKLMIEKMIDEL